MTEQLDPTRAEARLRAHYATLDPGKLRPEAAARIRAQLGAAAGVAEGAATSRLRLDPVRVASPRSRVGLGWPLATAAVVALLLVSWVAVDRLAGPRVAGSPSALLSPGASAPAPASPGVSAASAVPSPSAQSTGPAASGSASDQRAIAFTDRRHGIVVGGYQGRGAVWATADEGQSWTSSTLPTPPLDSVAVLGSRAWASATCATADAGCTPSVLSSQDGGATWAVVAATPVGSLTFADAEHGWGVDTTSPASARLLATADGGRTWAAASGSAPCEADYFPIAVSFGDASHGWVACGSGRAALGSSPKEIAATADGAATWSIRSRADGGVATPNSLPFAGMFRGIQMLASGTGVAWMWNVGLVRTTDGGATWARLPLGPETGNLQWPGASVTGDGGLFALTVDLASNDASATFNVGLGDGRDWKPYVDFARLPSPGTTASPQPTDPPQAALADAVAFFDATHGVAVGGDRTHAYAWRTADGGKTWAVSPLGATAADAVAVHASIAWASVRRCPAGVELGDASCVTTLERSADGGASWTEASRQALTSISFGDDLRGFGVGPLAAQPGAGVTIGGSGGGIYATIDGGATWQPLAEPYPCGTYSPVSVSFVSATRGWVGCSGAVGAGQGMKAVMETDDGGRTWSVRARLDVPGTATSVGSIPSSDYLDTISMQPDGSGLMTGLRGLTFRTADGGRTWKTCPPGEFDAAQTSGAAIVPAGPWFVVQSGWITQDSSVMQGRLLRSDDRGATWTQVGPLMPSP